MTVPSKSKQRTATKPPGAPLERGASAQNTPRLEGLESLLRTARARARSYRHTAAVTTMTYFDGRASKTSSIRFHPSKNPYPLAWRSFFERFRT